MIEMMGVLAITGVLAVAGAQGFSKLMMQRKVQQTIDQISMISSKLSAIGSEATSYGGLSNKSAVKFKAVPSEAIVGNGSDELVNPFGGEIAIEADSLIKGNNDNQSYSITYTGIPEEACINLASNDWGSSGSSSLVAVGVGNDSGKLNTLYNAMYQDCKGEASDEYTVACVNGENVSTPISIDAAVLSCGCSGDSCVLVVKYY